MRVIAIALFGLLLSAQTASVTILTPADAKEAFAAYTAMKDAEKKWEAVQSKLKRTYGIERDMEFSSDFKTIVQKNATSGMTILDNGTLMWNGSKVGAGGDPSYVIPCSAADHRPMSEMLTNCVAW